MGQSAACPEAYNSDTASSLHRFFYLVAQILRTGFDIVRYVGSNLGLFAGAVLDSIPGFLRSVPNHLARFFGRILRCDTCFPGRVSDGIAVFEALAVSGIALVLSGQVGAARSVAAGPDRRPVRSGV